MERFTCTGSNDDLIRGVREIILFFELCTYSRAKFRDTIITGIAGLPFLNRFDSGILDMPGGIEIRLPKPEIDRVRARSFKQTSYTGNFNVFNPVCKLWSHKKSPLFNIGMPVLEGTFLSLGDLHQS